MASATGKTFAPPGFLAAGKATDPVAGPRPPVRSPATPQPRLALWYCFIPLLTGSAHSSKIRPKSPPHFASSTTENRLKSGLGLKFPRAPGENGETPTSSNKPNQNLVCTPSAPRLVSVGQAHCNPSVRSTRSWGMILYREKRYNSTCVSGNDLCRQRVVNFKETRNGQQKISHR